MIFTESDAIIVVVQLQVVNAVIWQLEIAYNVQHANI